MIRASQTAIVTTLVLCLATMIGFKSPSRAAELAPQPRPKSLDLLTTSAISTILNANGGKPPATGDQLWKTLSKLGGFAQLPVVFSAVRLDSGLANPRVVIAPVVSQLSDAAPNQPNLAGRLYLAANMEREPNGLDPRVTSVEFISWNTARRQFDFGVIENMGGESQSPELRVVDGGRCFSCHKNRGPIFGVAPWSTTTHHSAIRALVANKLLMVPVLQPGLPFGVRDRIDGMALVAPEAEAVSDAIRVGRQLRLYRETFRLMNRSPAGRKAFVALLMAIVEPGVLDPNDAETNRLVNAWEGEPSYSRFQDELQTLMKTTNSGSLIDFVPLAKRLYESWGAVTLKPVPQPPPGGFRTQLEAQLFQQQVDSVTLNNNIVNKRFAEAMEQIPQYDLARSKGNHGLKGSALPSNPKAFVTEVLPRRQKPSDIVHSVLLTGTIGLTVGDRHFLIHSLDVAVERLNNRKVTAKTLARAVFEGSEFADVLAGGPLPDRDEFKDRFIEGLDKVLKTKYMHTEVFNTDRREYTSSPRYDPKAVEELEAVVVPTTACLRCHDVRATGKARMFESIPALAFDPLDKKAREAWLKSATKERKQEVLPRIQARLFKDADMPPQDSPERDKFRVKEAAAFDQLKSFLDAELEKIK